MVRSTKLGVAVETAKLANVKLRVGSGAMQQIEAEGK
jgi:hypothetical protein